MTFLLVGGHQQPLKGSLDHLEKITKNCQEPSNFQRELIIFRVLPTKIPMQMYYRTWTIWKMYLLSKMVMLIARLTFGGVINICIYLYEYIYIYIYIQYSHIYNIYTYTTCSSKQPPKHPSAFFKAKGKISDEWLVTGWNHPLKNRVLGNGFNPFEKYARQIGANFPR